MIDYHFLIDGPFSVGWNVVWWLLFNAFCVWCVLGLCMVVQWTIDDIIRADNDE